MEHHDPTAPMNWPMAPDLTEEYDALFTIDEEELPELQVHFDPTAFTKVNP